MQGWGGVRMEIGVRRRGRSGGEERNGREERSRGEERDGVRATEWGERKMG